ncbi:hypothetical protein CK203_011516 [Vitis vinifera]|uniref:Reverse transcriptase zinc-binding domain-containing protein n=1 Tax=Vitis vinifera TaxID=29760 RepID=A0A438JU80_VITVI|nr:hypothetical protein CK203_011516 [Vitis vinifera]
MANAHRRRNQLTRVKVSGRWLTEESEIKEEVSRVFQGLLADLGGWKPNIDGLIFERLGEQDVEGLEKSFLEEEVFGALSSFCEEKASSLDGFSMAFWQYSWDFVKVEVMIFFRQFHESGALNKLDLKSNRGTILCKLDIEKAYDHVDWSFLLAVLEKMGEQLLEVFYRLAQIGEEEVKGSRLKVNLEKSELIPVGRVENVEELVEEFGYKVGRLPSTYLGMLLGAPFKSTTAWDGIEERFHKSLAMWKRQYISKGEKDYLNSKKAYGVGLWKAISKVGHLVTPSFDFVVGAGKNMRFWKDKWCGTTPLCKAFPGLFALATSKEAWVNEVWTTAGERKGSWSPCFTRPFNDWEIEEVSVDEEDRVRWMESKDGVFSIKSLYRVLQPVSLVSFPSKVIWNSCVQSKLSFFVWEASWGRVLTLDRLQKRG